jgi:hypothetical protein
MLFIVITLFVHRANNISHHKTNDTHAFKE